MLYLSAADVVQCLPAPAEQVDRIREAFLALGSSAASSPPKLGLELPAENTLEAMPAVWHARELASVKWVAAFPHNREAGQPQVHATLILTDLRTGKPLCVMDGRPLTAARTAAVSAFALQSLLGRSASLTIAGAGVQGEAHAKLLLALELVDELTVYDRHPDRAESLVARLRELTVVNVVTADNLEAALTGSDAFVSCVSLGPSRQAVPPDWFRHLQTLICVDDDMSISPTVVSERLFVVDDLRQFRAFRDAGHFTGFRDPDAELSQVARLQSRQAHARAAFITIGTAIADLAIAEAVYMTAGSSGLGTPLPT